MTERLPLPRPDSRFAGLDALRGLAALFVVLGHIPLNQAAAGLPNPNWGAFFYRGAPAVCFFFTLSGFLITHLLLRELRRTQSVDVYSFYLRRACRIWPLYFFVVAAGLLLYKVVLPALGIPHPAEYPITLAVALYAFFLPNLMNSLFAVGGVLNPLWSIGIEEQFYLVWAPLVRWQARRLRTIAWCVLVAFLAIDIANSLHTFGVGRHSLFLSQVKFHYIAAGALCALALQRDDTSLMARPWFRSRALQIVLILAIVDFYSINVPAMPDWAGTLLQLVLYPWLILEVAVNPRRIVKLQQRHLTHLGTISYGIYMLHMFAIYATSQFFRMTTWWLGRPMLYVVVYYAMAFAGTILLAQLSYRWLERPFLSLKDRRYAAPPPASVPVSVLLDGQPT